MTRRLGVLVALLALATTASADKAKKPAPKPTATKPDPKAAAKKPPADADPAAGDAATGSDAPPTAAEIEAALPPHINGPKVVDLGNNTEIEVPAGMILLEKVEAQKMLQKGGDSAETVVAAVGKVDAEWLLVIEYEDAGYVDDGDADDLKPDELFQQYQEGTKQQNERRKTLGVPELFLDGWSEMPKYVKADHHLVWGLKGHSTSGPVINFFTRILGRNGYLSVDLIDAPDRIEKSKVDAQQALGTTRFKPGFKYEDHKSGDKSSGIGLRALVLGGAGIAVLKAAKAGIFIKLLLIFKKAIIFVVVAIGGFFKWLFGKGKKKNDDVDFGGPPPSDPNDPPPGGGYPPNV